MFSKKDTRHEELATLPKNWDELLDSQLLKKYLAKPDGWKRLVRHYVATVTLENEEQYKEFFEDFWLRIYPKCTDEAGLFEVVQKGCNKFLDIWLQSMDVEGRRALVCSHQRNGDTALHDAAKSGNKRIASILISAGALVNAQGQFHESPLHRAAYYNQTKVARLLLDNNANIKALRHDGEMAIHIAVMAGAKEIVELLVAHDPDQINVSGRSSRTPLYRAVMSGKIDLIEYFVGLGVDVNEINRFSGYAPIHLAAMHNKPDVIACLIESGAQVDLEDASHLTALQRCVAQDLVCLEAAAELIKHGANTNAGQEPPLYLLASRVNNRSAHAVDAAKLLLRGGANLHAEIAGYTAVGVLHEAKQNGLSSQYGEQLLRYLTLVSVGRGGVTRQEPSRKSGKGSKG